MPGPAEQMGGQVQRYGPKRDQEIGRVLARGLGWPQIDRRFQRTALRPRASNPHHRWRCCTAWAHPEMALRDAPILFSKSPLRHAPALPLATELGGRLYVNH